MSENVITNENIVSFKKVCVDYQMKKYSIRANTDVSFNIKKNYITALVGESGSGKTTIASALINCLVEPGKIVDGEIIFDDLESIDVVKLSNKDIRKFRWEQVSMVFQGAQSALNPVATIYNQFKETILVHDKTVKKEEILKRSTEVLEYVNLDANRVLKMYPHELSGGMKQRVMIAFAMLLNPKLIILDEPTTALDVITQDYIFNLLKRINKELNISMLLLTHDIGIVAKYADYVGVMYAGRIVEYADVFSLFKEPKHPYTKGLINATPSLYTQIELMEPIPGNPPDLMCLPSGCPFNPRCKKAFDLCSSKIPEDIYLNENHFVKCNLYLRGNKDE